MSPVDLTIARAAMAAELVDACVITTDREAETDDTLDDDTLELSGPGGDATTVYEGPCMIGPVLSEQLVEVGERRITRRRYRARLPHTAPVSAVGSQLTVTAAANDAELVGVQMLVTDVTVRTHTISRHVYLQHDQGERA